MGPRALTSSGTTWQCAELCGTVLTQTHARKQSNVRLLLRSFTTTLLLLAKAHSKPLRIFVTSTALNFDCVGAVLMTDSDRWAEGFEQYRDKARTVMSMIVKCRLFAIDKCCTAATLVSKVSYQIFLE